MAIPSDLEIARAALLKPLDDIAHDWASASTCSSPTARAWRRSSWRRSTSWPTGRRRSTWSSPRSPRPRSARARPPPRSGWARRSRHIGKRATIADPAAVDGPDVRHQGRRRRRRVQPGRADGDAEPAPDRRLPRGHRRAQPAVRDGRQPPAPGQRARPRPAQHHLAPGARRQRPGAAQHRGRARRAAWTACRGRPGSTSPRPPRSWPCWRCATSLHDLRARLGRIVVGYTTAGEPVTAEQLKAAGAMAVILRDAIKPNLLQTLENTPVLVHAGPFGNIAHRQLLGRRRPDRHPHRRLPHHRGRVRRRHGRRAVLQHQVPRVGPAAGRGRRRRHGPGAEGALRQATRSSRASRCPRTCSPRTPTTCSPARANLRKQIENVRLHGVSAGRGHQRVPDRPPRPSTTPSARSPRRLGARVAVCTHFADGGRGAAELAEAVAEAADEPSDFRFLYPSEATPAGEDRDRRDAGLRRRRRRLLARWPASQLDTYERQRVRHAAGRASPRRTCRISSRPHAARARPTGWTLPVREVRASVGAGFVYPICGEMRTMPGLGTNPAADRIDIDENGEIVGLS